MKAAVAFGWPHGIAEEFGRAALWAAELGINAIPALLDCMKAGPAAAAPRRMGGGLKFPEGAAAAISAMDRLDSPDVNCIALEPPAELIGLAAFAGAAAKARGVHIAATALDELLFDVGPARCDMPRSNPIPGCEILVRSEAAGPQLPPRMPLGGFRLEDSSWAQLKAAAAKSCVPATDYSRRMGAGAESSDND